MKQAIKNLMGPGWYYARMMRLLGRAAAASFGQAPRHCPLCGHQGRFLAEIHFPDIYNFDALCPGCGALPRNRLLWLALEREGLIRPADRVLHFAPEACLSERIRKRAGRYLTADLFADGVDLKLDIEAIDLPDESEDVVVCSHVLEHVDDHKAIAELYRILMPGGRALILVPVAEGWARTYEDGAITTPSARALHYGKDNHVRRYGHDVRARLAAPGFEVTGWHIEGGESVRHGLLPGEVLFICRKPGG